jgi:phosphate transport system permease protein
VWLTSMGLAVGLIMVVGLLGLILANGLGVFWPKPLLEIELRPGSPAALRGAPLIGGLQSSVRTKIVQRPGQERHPDREWHLMIGNRDVYGSSFRYVDLADAVAVRYPPEVMVIERMEYGHAIGRPLRLQLEDGREVAAKDPAFESSLETALQEVRKRREAIRDLERNRIGRINHEMEALRLREKSLADADGQALAALTARRTTLQAEYEVLAAEAARLRQAQSTGRLHYQILTGEEQSLPLGQLVSYHYPNQMGLADKLRFFFHGLARFVVEEPREANTEGGIFPAIFGTFVMTLLMSLAVTPFGVLAAVYLREYARQGLFVRAVRISVNNLAGVPSIVFGVFGLGFFVYFLGGSVDRLFFADALPTPTFGTGGILWAALTLALMTVPVVIVATEEALAAVPRGTREGSLALGASKWQTIYRVVLPASAPGILTGLVLAMARGAGEVAPLMLVGVVKLAPSLPIDRLYPFVHLDQKFMHLGFHIYDLGFQSPDSDAAKPMVFATTLFLIGLVVALNLGAIIIRERLRRRYATGAF